MVDLRGFGYSGGPRASCQVYELHWDLHTLLEQIDDTLPLFLMGFSMGGMLVSSFLLNNPHLSLAGAILINPLIKLPSNTQMEGPKGVLIKSIGQDLKDIVTNSMINVSSLSKDVKQMSKVFKDKMNLPFMGMNFAKYMLECTEFIQDHCHQFKYPLLMQLGKKDTVLDSNDSQHFYDQVKL